MFKSPNGDFLFIIIKALLFISFYYYINMRKLITLLFGLLLITNGIALADDLWDNYGDHNIYDQKPVSDKEFEQALDKKKGKVKKNKNIPKGSEFHQSNETQFINDAENVNLVLGVPIKLRIGAKVLPEGHYQIKAVREGEDVYIRFYQAHFVKAEVPAIETQDDFGKETLYFAELFSINEKQVKVIYGSIDLNAYAVIDIAE